MLSSVRDRQGVRRIDSDACESRRALFRNAGLADPERSRKIRQP